MKERISGLRNESSKTKRTGLFQRITAAFPPPFLIISQVSFTSLPVLSLFWHILVGIEDIIADHVHQEMTRNLILVYLRLCLLIVIKDVFLSLVSFPNKSKNLMVALAATNGLALRKQRSDKEAESKQPRFLHGTAVLARRKIFFMAGDQGNDRSSALALVVVPFPLFSSG